MVTDIPADEPIVKRCFSCADKAGKPLTKITKQFHIAQADTLYSCPDCGRLWANGEYLEEKT